MSISEAKRKIQPKEVYDLSRIRNEGLFPWITHIATIRKLVKRDYQGDNVLKAVIGGIGRGTNYEIKGLNLLKFLDKYGHGFMMSVKQKIK